MLAKVRVQANPNPEISFRGKMCLEMTATNDQISQAFLGDIHSKKPQQLLLTVPVETLVRQWENRTARSASQAQGLFLGNPIQNFHGEPGSVIGSRITAAAQAVPCNEPVMAGAGFKGLMAGFHPGQIQPEPLTTEVTSDLCPAEEIRGSFLGGENESQRSTCNESVTSRADNDGRLYV